VEVESPLLLPELDVSTPLELSEAEVEEGVGCDFLA
jgi:hypothetical protein